MNIANKRVRDPAKIIAIFLGATVFVAVVVTLVAKMRSATRRPLVVSHTKDWSGSTPAGTQCLEHTTHAAVNRASDQVEFIYARTGDENTALEPVQPVRSLQIRKSDMPWSAGPKTVEKLVDEFIASVSRSSTSKRTKMSPLFVAVDRAVSDLRPRSDSDRIVIIESDLEDTTMPAMTIAFQQKPGTKVKGLPKIDNEGILVHFVATEDTVGTVDTTKTSFTAPRTPNRIERLEEVWKGCFTHPELVTFSPSCNNPLP